MATRFYLRSSGSPSISPSYGSGSFADDVSNWNDTGGAARLTMGPDKLETSHTTRSRANNSDSTGYKVLLAQFVSDALAEQVLGGDITGFIGTRESNAAAEYYIYSMLKLVSSTGTLKHLFAVSSESGGTEFTTSTNYVARHVFRQGTVNSNPVQVAAGDRLVYEVGYERNAAVTTNYTGYIRIGDSQASDIASHAATTASANSWLEFSDDVYFSGDSDVPLFEEAAPSASDSGGSGLSWSDLSNTYVRDGDYALSSTTSGLVGNSQSAQYLQVTNFGLNIPSVNTVHGVAAIVYLRSSNTTFDVGLTSGQLVNSGSTIGSSQSATSGVWTEGKFQELGIGGKNSTWGATLTPALVNSSTFGVRLNMWAQHGGFLGSSSIRVDSIHLLVSHTPPDNESPELSAGPTVSYGSWTRTGPNNTPISVAFTYTDAEETASNELDYTIDTAAAGGGTEVGSGTMTSGVEKVHSLAYNASGLASGSNTLYVYVTDGTTFSPDNPSFTVLRDDAAPDIGTITVFPDVVEPE